MATFTEKANVVITDNASVSIKKINAELKKMAAIASTLNRKNAGLSINTKNIQKADAALKGFIQTVSKLKGKSVKINVDSRQLDSAIRKIANLKNKVVPVKVVTTPTTSPAAVNKTPALNGALLNTAQAAQIGRIMGKAHVGALQSWSTNFIGNLKSQIIHRGSAGTVAGLMDTAGQGLNRKDANNRILASQNYTPEEIGALEKQAAAISQRAPSLSADMVTSLMADIAPNNDKKDIGFVTQQLMRVVQQQITAGVDSTQAIDGMRYIAKGLDQNGQLRDSKGNLQRDTLEAFIDAVTKSAISSGKDFNPEKVGTSIKMLKSAGATITPEALQKFFIIQEDLGVSAGNQLLQMEKQLKGRALIKALDAQEKFGLRSSEEVPIKGKKGKTKTSYGEIVDQELLVSDPFQWFNENIFPELVKRKVDLNSPVAIQKELEKLFSRDTAESMAQKLAQQMGEIDKRIKRENGEIRPEGVPGSKPGYKTSIADSQKILDESLVASFDATVNNVGDALGNMIYSLKDGLIPVLQTVTNLAQGLSSFIKNDDGTVDPLKSGVVAGAGIVGTGLAAIGTKKVFESLTGLGGNTTATVLNTAALNANTIANGGIVAAGKGKGGILAGGKKALLGVIVASAVVENLPPIVDAVSETPKDSKTVKNVQKGGEALINAFNAYNLVPGPVQVKFAAAILAAAIAFSDFKPRKNVLIDPASERRNELLKKMGPFEGGFHRNGREKELYPAVGNNPDAIKATELLNVLSTSIKQGACNIKTTVESGSSQIQGAIQTLPSTGGSFGAFAGQTLAAYGSQFGSAAGSMISAAVANIRVNVPTQITSRPASDTGRQPMN